MREAAQTCGMTLQVFHSTSTFAQPRRMVSMQMLFADREALTRSALLIQLTRGWNAVADSSGQGASTCFLLTPLHLGATT